ncbi:hypothetical protein [Photorhabdus sp. SF281]|uniref:hypothetical protein n=1 Tax=Photorhabdus sp. SF281 TaxID=3459527 RepID=UPI004044479D
MMINHINQVFSSEDEIFKYHFPDNPVVPGILPVAAFCKEMADKSVDFINLKNLFFYQFIRPDENIKYSQERNKISATVSGKLCFSFFLDYSGKDEKCESGRALFSSSLFSLPLRKPEFWFLPKTVYVDEISNSANCHLDIKSLQHESDYLQKFHYASLLILVEAMGNLALVLQHQQKNMLTESDYVFARFGELTFSPNIEHINSPVFIETQVTRFGSIMCWNAWAYSEGEKLLWINDAISIKRKENDVG